MSASPRFSQLVRSARARCGFDLGTTARAAGCSESYVSLIEADKRLPSEDLAMRLADTLGLHPTDALLALLRSRLPAASRDMLEPEALVREPMLQFAVVRRFLSGHLDARAEQMHSRVDLEWSGDAALCTTLKGVAPVPRSRSATDLVVRERLPDGSPGQFASGQVKPRILESPPGLHFEYQGEAQGREYAHHFTFPDGFAAGAGWLSFETRLSVRQAVAMDLQSTLAVQGAQPRNHLLCWSFPRFLTHAVDHLVLELRFPDGYRADAVTPWAWLGDSPFADAATNRIDGGVCLAHEFTFDGQRACLEVREPLPFYTFTLAWRPMERADRIAARNRLEA